VKYADQRFGHLAGPMAPGTATLVEVHTLGEQGLRYRHRFRKTPSAWIHVDAVPAPRLADSCGSGDWCTAGFLAKVAAHGLRGLCAVGPQGLQSAVRYGQALAAWNCGFEGARGGMYAVGREAFDAQIGALLAGQLDRLADARQAPSSEALIDCPACPQSQPRLDAPPRSARKVAGMRAVGPRSQPA
jgi:fructokinase